MHVVEWGKQANQKVDKKVGNKGMTRIVLRIRFPHIPNQVKCDTPRHRIVEEIVLQKKHLQYDDDNDDDKIEI